MKVNNIRIDEEQIKRIREERFAEKLRQERLKEENERNQNFSRKKNLETNVKKIILGQ